MAINRDAREARKSLVATIIAAGGAEGNPLQGALNYYAENSTINQAQFQELLNQALPGNNFQVEQLGGQNNKNFKIKNLDDNAVVIIQFGRCRETAHQAMQLLSKNGDRPSWLADQYARNSTADPFNQDNTIDNKLNQFDYSSKVNVTAMEMCATSLDSRIRELHQNPNTQPQQVVDFAANVGVQMNYILNQLDKAGVVWTDMKIGNLLLRENDAVVVADTKAFLPVDQMIMKHHKTSGNEQVKLEDLTPPYLSQYFNDKVSSDAVFNRQEIAADLQKEYSYQFGMALYSMLSGLDQHQFIAQGFESDLGLNFKFPAFQGQQGQNMKFIIEALTDGNPFKRIGYQDATELLKAVKNQEKFGQLADKAVDRMQKQDLSNMSTMKIFGRLLKGKTNLKEVMRQKDFGAGKEKYEQKRSASDAFGEVKSRVETAHEKEAKQERTAAQKSVIRRGK